MLSDKLSIEATGERRRVRMVIAGGDGTIAWVLNTLHQKKFMQVGWLFIWQLSSVEKFGIYFITSSSVK